MLASALSPIRLAEAKGSIEKIAKPVTGDRKIARPLNEKGLLAFREENYPVAVDLLKQAVAADAADVEARNNYVFALIKTKNIDDAEREIGVCLGLAPGRSSAWANLSEIYAAKGNIQLSSLALIVAFQFSSNKDRTLTFLREKSAATDNTPLAEAAKIALDKLTTQ